MIRFGRTNDGVGETIVMGDVSAEPSMEDILSSIKRIISEESDPAPRARRPGPRPISAPPPQVAPAYVAPSYVALDDDDEILELSDPVPDTPVRATAIPAHASVPPEPIVSREAAQATRGALDTLSRLLVKPEAGSDGTLEGMVREMLRPMLREWIDANLPTMVETLVASEIAKITGSTR